MQKGLSLFTKIWYDCPPTTNLPARQRDCPRYHQTSLTLSRQLKLRGEIYQKFPKVGDQRVRSSRGVHAFTNGIDISKYRADFLYLIMFFFAYATQFGAWVAWFCSSLLLWVEGGYLCIYLQVFHLMRMEVQILWVCCLIPMDFKNLKIFFISIFIDL